MQYGDDMDDEQQGAPPVADGQITLDGDTVRIRGGEGIVHGGQGVFFPHQTQEVRWGGADKDLSHRWSKLPDGGAECSCGWFGGPHDSWVDHYNEVVKPTTG